MTQTPLFPVEIAGWMSVVLQDLALELLDCFGMFLNCFRSALDP